VARAREAGITGFGWVRAFSSRWRSSSSEIRAHRSPRLATITHSALLHVSRIQR
jgi:hypothetical protein